jgi:hypothetical protein
LLSISATPVFGSEGGCFLHDYTPGLSVGTELKFWLINSSVSEMIIKKFLLILFVSALFCGFMATVQAENHAEQSLLEVLPGECFLDGIFSSQNTYINDMDGFEVPLVASWSPAEHDEKTRYAGDARFGVFNFKIGEGKLIDTYTVDIDLRSDDPTLSDNEKDTLLVYECEKGSKRCTATLVTIKAAITEQIARDYHAEVGEVIFHNDARATLLGVFVKGMKPRLTDKPKEKNIRYRLTEVCGMYELRLAEGHPVSSLIRQSITPN